MKIIQKIRKRLYSNFIVRYIYDKLYHLMNPIYKFPVDIRNINIEHIGGGRGGARNRRYEILPEALSDHPIIFSFGIGDDIEAEIDAMERYGAYIYAFDPTPKVKEWIELNIPKRNFEFESLGLSNNDGQEKFFFPENKEFISGSIRKESVDWQTLSDEYTIVRCERLKTIMERVNVNKIDYLKICIEGMEYEVMQDILKSQLDIGQIAIAFCGNSLPKSYKKDKRLYKSMRKRGYKTMEYQNPRRITFVRRERR